MVEGRARFVSVRNPLDILVSNAFEIEHVLPVMRGVDRIPPDAREVYGRTRLDDDCWVDGTARYIARFYETWLERRRDLVDHRYEQLLEQPVATIQGLASVLGRSIDSSTAQSLWEQVGHRPLKANPAHFFRPGAEKWRQYLDDRHASTLREIGWPALFDELGYSFPSRFSRVRAAGSRPSGRSRRELAIGDEMNHCMFGTPLRFRDTSIIAVEEGSTRVVANDRTWLESAALFSRGGTECSSLVRTDEVEVKSRG